MILPLIAPEGQLSITSILKHNPNKKRTERIKRYFRKLLMHNTGVGLEKAIEAMDYFEKPELLELRKKYSPSNTDLFGRLHRPLDKVFQARGGSAFYRVPDEKDFKRRLGDVHGGYSLKEWLEVYWFSAANYDPMGLVFMEVGADETYPTYKCSETIYDYPVTRGRKLEYVVFRLPADSDCINNTATADMPAAGAEQRFRVVDDMWDYTVTWDGEAATIVERFSNYFNEVPAITVGWIYDHVRAMYVSPDDQVIDAADQYLRNRSVMTMFKLHHGFPMKWQYAGVCPTCKGTGSLKGDTCPSCGGSTYKSKYDVSETIVLPVPKSKDQPILTPDVAGYVTPPVATWQQMLDDIQQEYAAMHYTLWGTHQVEDSEQQTATGRFIDVQPVNERLGQYSRASEFTETWITDMMGWFYYGPAYGGCDINYGRRYLVETPDIIWEKYADSRTKGASVATLDNLLLQYLQSEFQSDGMELMRQVKLMKLEPWVHMTTEQVKALGVPETDYLKKLYFGRWVNQLKPNDLINKDLGELDELLEAYVIKQGMCGSGSGCYGSQRLPASAT